MNTTFISAAAAAFLCAHATSQAQQAPVAIYGRLNLALESVRPYGSATNGSKSAVRESNYRSVLGFHGREPLGGDLNLIFQVEGTIAPDTGSGAIAARDTRLGFEAGWGTLFVGNWTTPYNSSTATLDPFYPTTAGYMSIMGNGAAASANNVSDKTSFDRRQQNSLNYWTPALHGVSLRLAHGFNEETAKDGAKPSLDSGSLIYARGPLYLALAHERHRHYQGPGRTDWGVKIAAAYQFGTTRAAAIAEKLHYETGMGDLERISYYLSLSRQIGPHGIRFGLGKANDGFGVARDLGFIRSGDATGAVHATLGYDYTLSKRTSLFAFTSRLRNDTRGVYDFAINSVAPAEGASLGLTAIGIRHSF